MIKGSGDGEIILTIQLVSRSSQRSLEAKEGKQDSQRRRWGNRSRGGDDAVAGFEMKEGRESRDGAASGSRKRQRHSPGNCQHLGVSPETCFRCLTSRTV